MGRHNYQVMQYIIIVIGNDKHLSRKYFKKEYYYINVCKMKKYLIKCMKCQKDVVKRINQETNTSNCH